MACVTLVYPVLGMLLDPLALLTLSLPITLPVMMQLGYDPVWFGIYRGAVGNRLHHAAGWAELFRGQGGL